MRYFVNLPGVWKWLICKNPKTHGSRLQKPPLDQVLSTGEPPHIHRFQFSGRKLSYERTIEQITVYVSPLVSTFFYHDHDMIFTD